MRVRNSTWSRIYRPILVFVFRGLWCKMQELSWTEPTCACMYVYVCCNVIFAAIYCKMKELYGIDPMCAYICMRIYLCIICYTRKTMQSVRTALQTQAQTDTDTDTRADTDTDTDTQTDTATDTHTCSKSSCMFPANTYNPPVYSAARSIHGPDVNHLV